MKTRPMRMKWAFVIRMAGRDMGADPREFGPSGVALFVAWANRNPDLFPKGMGAEDARWILENPEAFTDGEP